MHAFKSSATNLLTIECDDKAYSQESLLGLYNSLLSSITEVGSKKKIILVYHKEKTKALAEHFRSINALKYYDVDDEISLQDFKPC